MKGLGMSDQFLSRSFDVGNGNIYTKSVGFVGEIIRSTSL